MPFERQEVSLMEKLNETRRATSVPVYQTVRLVSAKSDLIWPQFLGEKSRYQKLGFGTCPLPSFQVQFVAEPGGCLEVRRTK